MMNRQKFLVALGAGALLSACGESSGNAAKKEPTPVAWTPEELAARVHGFAVGQTMARNTVYVFFDAQCPHCATLWKASEPLQKQVRFVWVPVGVLSRASVTQGGFILSSADPVATMNEHEALMSAKKGGISALSGVSDEATDKIKRNTEVFTQLGATSIPFIVARHATSNAMISQAGAMPTEALANLLGLTTSAEPAAESAVALTPTPAAQ